MANFRKVPFGYVDSRLLDPTLTVINQILSAYISSAQNMEMKIDPASIKEVMELGEKITGGDFRHFLMANYEQGRGKRARLVRSITQFLQGKIDGRMLAQTITGDEQIVSTTQLKHVKNEYNASIDYRGADDVERFLQGVVQNDLYVMVEGIGPHLYARMLITLTGETAYARK